jgi:hypothetical protein
MTLKICTSETQIACSNTPHLVPLLRDFLAEPSLRDCKKKELSMIPNSLEGRPSLPDQMRASAPFDPLDLATFVVFGTLFGIVAVAGVTLVIGRAAASLIDRAPDSERDSPPGC